MQQANGGIKTCLFCRKREHDINPENGEWIKHLKCGECSMCVFCSDKYVDYDGNILKFYCGCPNSKLFPYDTTPVITPEGGVSPVSSPHNEVSKLCVCGAPGYLSPCGNSTCFTCKNHWIQSCNDQLLHDEKKCTCGATIESWKPSNTDDAALLEVCFEGGKIHLGFECDCGYQSPGC